MELYLHQCTLNAVVFRHILGYHGIVVEISRSYWLQIQIAVKKVDIDFPVYVLAYEVSHPRTRGRATIFNFGSCASVARCILQWMQRTGIKSRYWLGRSIDDCQSRRCRGCTKPFAPWLGTSMFEPIWLQ